MIWPNTLCLLQQDLAQHWPESSALDNAEDFCLATLPIALPPKNFCLKLPNSVRNAKTFVGNAIGNVANQKLTTLPRPDDLGH